MEQQYNEQDLAGLLRGMQPVQSLSGTGGVVNAIQAQLGIDASAPQPGIKRGVNALEDFLNPQHEKPTTSAPAVNVATIAPPTMGG